MWYCKQCNENHNEPGTWNANTKKFLCANCLSPLSEQAVEQNIHPTVGESAARGVSTQAYSLAKLFAGQNPHCG